jgi:hypothetical protein
LNKSFQSLSGETVYRYNFNNGILKVYAAFDSSKLDINQESINAPDKIRVGIDNNNYISIRRTMVVSVQVGSW